jgi:DNA-binding NarL/FixJ family response regulator
MIKVGIVDDHAIVRSGLKQFFSEQVDLRVVGEAASGREAIDLVRVTEMDVLVMDLSMPGQSGIDALGMIRAKAPDVGILILSGYPEEHYAMNLIRQGASGYLNKECEPMEIVNAIRTIALGRRYISPGGGRTAGAAAQPQGRRRAARAAVRARVPGVPEAGQGRDRRRHRQGAVAVGEDGEHVPHAPDGEDEPLLQQRPHVLRAEEQADRLISRGLGLSCLGATLASARQ